MKSIFLTAWVVFFAVRPSFAQKETLPDTATSSTESDVEQLYDKFEKDDNSRKEKQTVQAREKDKAKPDLSTLSDLGALAPFDDIAVIERRYLPKTNRFELSASGLTGLNNPFFNNLGIAVRAAYYFREKYGLELMYDFIGTSARQVTQNLSQNRSIATSSFVTPQGFLGAAFKWNPIYGKITFLNDSIVPFDMNFSLGLGLTNTNSGQEAPTLHVGTGQVYALSKAWALRIDLTWNFYEAQSTQTDGTKKTGFQDDLMLALGVSFFFPEAKYR